MKKLVFGGVLKVLAGGVIVILGTLFVAGGGYDVGLAAGVDGTCRIITKHLENGEDMLLSEFAEKYGVKE